MIQKYLKNAVERRQVTYPHPHFSRSVIIDDEVVPLDTYENTPYDDLDLGSPVSVTDQIRSGVTLKPMGSMPETSGLNAARVASAFVQQFNALAEPMLDSEPVPDAPAAPAVPAAPAAPSAE